MTQLLSVSVKNQGVPDGFPFSVSTIRTMETLDLSPPVTLLVGENGTGKFTLLEALAMGVHRSSIGEMTSRYEEAPDAHSHGDAFLNLFRSRLVPQGLFLMDEPEAALSPQSQLAFLAMVRDFLQAPDQYLRHLWPSRDPE